MMKLSKKFIAIMLTFVFVLSLVPFSVSAETVDVKITNTKETGTKKIAGNLRGGDSVSSANTASNPPSKNGTGSNRRIAYFQYDISDYLPFLSDSDTSFNFAIQHGGTSGSGRYAFAYDLYLVKGDHVDTSSGTPTPKMTMNYARTELGIVGAATSFTLNTNSSNLIKVASYVPTSSNGKDTKAVIHTVSAADIKEAVGDSGWVTFILPTTVTSTSDTTYFLRDDEDTYLQVTYNPENAASDQDYLDELVNSIEWSDLSEDESTAVINSLPTEYRGTTIEWSSDPAGVVNADGTLNVIRTEQSATLTATFTYTGTETVTATKSFDVTIAPEQMVTTDAIVFTNYGVARSDKETCQKYGVNTDRNCHYTYFGSIYAAYAQFDLSDYEEILRTPSSQVSFKVMGGNGYTQASSPRLYDFKVFLAPDSADGYRYDEINYADAEKLGMLNKELPVLCERIDSAGVRTTVTLEVNKANLLDCLNQSAGNGLVTIAYGVGESGKQCSVRPDYADTGLFISYYESELNSESYFESLKPSFTWENITKDDADVLVNNLPTYFKGADVEWSSTNGYVNSDGTLNSQDGKFLTDKVTATVSYKGYSFTSEEFEVTICDGKVTLDSPSLVVADGTATASISVTNGTAEAVTYYTYLVVYTDGEMTELIPVTLKVDAGKIGNANPTCAVPAGSTAKFLVWKSDNKTPATVALVQ